MRQIAPNVGGEHALPNAHPPIVSLIAFPFLFLDFDAAYIISGLFGWTFMLWAMRIIAYGFEL